jgi:SAM-dependent methyltransferase
MGDTGELCCPEGHRYPVVDGIPVLLVPESRATHQSAVRSYEEASKPGLAPVGPPVERRSGIDPYVQEAVAATNGIMWKQRLGSLRSYPIPEVPLPRAAPGGTAFLDVGCNWGRWCVAAWQLGYSPAGIDVNLEAVRAAYRVAEQLGVEAGYVVADARHLPFLEDTFPIVFSYSVLQHFDKVDAQRALAEASRVVSPGGQVVIQMPNRYGLRCLYHQARRGFRRARAFEVRYWGPHELVSIFGRLIGPTRLSVDGYFSLNAQRSEAYQLSLQYRAVVRLSQRLQALSRRLPSLLHLADSLWVMAEKPRAPRERSA